MASRKPRKALGHQLRRASTSKCAASVAETSACELNAFAIICEEYIEEISKLLPTQVEYARRAINTLLNFERKLDELVLRQSQVDWTVTRVKEHVGRALHFARKYRDACVKAAAYGVSKREIQNCSNLNRLMTFVETMTALFANCKTRLDKFMSASESAKDFIHASVEKMEEQRRFAHEQMDKSIIVAVVGGAAAIGGLFLTGPVGGLAIVFGILTAVGGTTMAHMKASQMETYSRGLQEITRLSRDLRGARMIVDALQQKMSECHDCLCRAGRHHAMKRRDVVMTFTAKKSICQALNSMSRNFGEVRTLAAM